MMFDEPQRRNYAPILFCSYIHAVEDFNKYFGRSPYRLGPALIRQYQAHLFRDCKLLAGTIQIKIARLPGELHLKISSAVEPLGKLPSRPGDSCDQREIGSLTERFRCLPVVAGPGEHVASDFRPRRDDALVA